MKDTGHNKNEEDYISNLIFGVYYYKSQSKIYLFIFLNEKITKVKTTTPLKYFPLVMHEVTRKTCYLFLLGLKQIILNHQFLVTH